MITVPGRILSTPSLVYRNRKQVTPISASWNMMNHQFNKANPVSNWSMLRLVLQPNRRESRQENPQQIRIFRDMLQKCGLNLGQSQDFTANLSSDGDQNDRAIRATLERISRTPARILLVILPNDDKHTYSRIKFWADFKLGKWAQCAEELHKYLLIESSRNPYSMLSCKKVLRPKGAEAVLRQHRIEVQSENGGFQSIDKRRKPRYCYRRHDNACWN